MPETLSLARLLTRKGDVSRTRLDTFEIPVELQPGEVRLGLETFALTANNITYAAFGEAMRYWEFFPSGEVEWGLMPVWGFATVVASNVADIAVGERFYGYFPIADQLRVFPERISRRGFYDGAAHRQALPSPYNQYTRCAGDPGYLAEFEDLQMLLRPLFFTSYMLADFLADHAYFGAGQVVISSASSKTAYGTAFALRERTGTPKLVALTSPGNCDYVARLELFDRVHTYDDVEMLDPRRPTVYVDYSGRDSLRRRVHRHYGTALLYDCYAGSASTADFLSGAERYDPPPRPFFAPTQIRKRNADWGPEVLAERFGEVQRRFLTAVADPRRRWLTIEPARGLAAAAVVIATLCNTGGSPETGYTVSVR